MRKLALLLCLLSATMEGQDFHRWAFNVGGGPSFGVGDAADRINTGYNVQVGGGYNFSKHFGLNIDYTFQSADLSNKALTAAGSPGGYAHAWGFSADPIYRIAPDRRLGGYVTGGFGVFTRTVNLTRPGVVPGVICDPWTFICYTGPVYADIIYRSNSVTKGGWNIGGGVTFRLNESLQFFTELRYYDILTSDVRTQLLPLTFGLRW
jgi:opacity protein-like surface antigen